MRFFSETLINGLNRDNLASGAIDCSYIFSLSVTSILTGAGQGTIKVEVSNDPPVNMPVNTAHVPQHWNTLVSKNIGLGNDIIPKTDICYQWARVSFTDTSIGEQTVTTIGDNTPQNQQVTVQTVDDDLSDSGANELQSFTCVADVAGSLSGTYFILEAWNASAQTLDKLYVWYNNGSSIDPAPPGRTGVEVSYTNDDSDVTIATATQAVLAALTQYWASVPQVGALLQMNAQRNGAVSPAADVNTGFTSFTVVQAGINPTDSLNNGYFTINAADNSNSYYVWLNIGGYGADPTPGGGLIGIEVTITSNDAAAPGIDPFATANDIATAIGTAIALVSAHFTTSVSTNIVTIVNIAPGPADTPANGSGLGSFTYAITVPGVDPGYSLNNTYFFLNAAAADGGTAYYVWYNVGGTGIDPLVPGKTGVEVGIVDGASADDVATATAGVIDALPEFSSSSMGNLIDIVNTSAGTFVAASDSIGNTATTFAFAVIVGAGTIILNVKTSGA